MPRDESIVVTLVWLRKAGKPAVLTQRSEFISSAGDYLVDIALMSHIKNDAVARRIIDTVQRNGQFHGAEIRRKMTAGMGDAVYHIAAQLLTQRLELALRQLFYII